MILAALYDYYQRKSLDPDEPLAPEGFERKEIPFVLVIDEDGELCQIDDFRYEKEIAKGSKNIKQKRAKPFLVPKDCGRTCNIEANLLWDKPDYVLGYVPQNASDKEQIKIKKRHQAFIDKFRQVFPPDFEDPGIRAVDRFLQRGNFEAVYQDKLWPDIISTTGAWLSFSLLDVEDNMLVCERPAVFQRILDLLDEPGDTLHGPCLVTGEVGQLTRLHPMIKGVPGAQSSGASLVSFNFDAALSYGLPSSLNAPVGKFPAFAYTTALNHMLGKDSKQKSSFNNTTLVFWAEEKLAPNTADIEEITAAAMQDNPDAGTEVVHSLLKNQPWKGRCSVNFNSPTRFYVLGLSPADARLSVRFWVVQTAGQMATNLRQHFKDLDITPYKPDLSRAWPLLSLLKSVAVEGDLKNIPRRLETQTLHAIITGKKYPHELLILALQRLQMQDGKAKKSSVKLLDLYEFYRTSLIKACLNRNLGKENKVSLDEACTDVAYGLGRLFALLEKLQITAHLDRRHLGKDDKPLRTLNRTIRSTHFGAASSRPSSVFPQLMQLHVHHLQKLEQRKSKNGWERPEYFDKEIKNIYNLLKFPIKNGRRFYPNQFSLEEQGAFTIGYYQQKAFRKDPAEPDVHEFDVSEDAKESES
jgi:CRISPR-associated protein Csd1